MALKTDVKVAKIPYYKVCLVQIATWVVKKFLDLMEVSSSHHNCHHHHHHGHHRSRTYHHPNPKRHRHRDDDNDDKSTQLAPVFKPRSELRTVFL